MKRTAFLWLAISSVLLLSQAADARTRPRYGGSLGIEVSGQLWEQNGIANSLVLETLTKVDEQGRVLPWLATRWESQNKDRRWVFTIRPGVKFHDASPLTAAAIVDSLNRCTSCPWKSISVMGEAVVFETAAPSPLLPAQLALPSFAIGKQASNGAPIGTGPMRVTEATANSASLAAFDTYWNGHSFIDRAEITSSRKFRDQWLDLGVARTDLIELPPEQVRRAQQEHLRSLASRNDELILLQFNSASSNTQDVRLREAIAASIDRASLLNFIFQRQGELAGGLLPNWLSGYAAVFPTSQNLQHARELRSQLQPLPTLTLTYDPADSSLQLIAERIALSARDAGITIRTQPAPAHWDLTLTRTRLASFQPSVALEELVSSIGADHKTPDDMTPEALFQRERDLLKTYERVPLLYVPHAFAAGERVRNWKLGDSGLPDLPNLWVQEMK